MNKGSLHQRFPILFLLVILVISLPVYVTGQDQYDSLLNVIEQADPGEQMKLHNQLGKLDYGKARYASAMEHFNAALTIAQDLNDSLQIAKYNSNIGVINDLLGNYSIAIEHYQRSLSIYDKLNNTEGKESVLNNIGIVYEEMKIPDKALDYYMQALALKIERGDQKSIAGTYNNIGIIYTYFKEDQDSAVYYYNKALDIYNQIDEERSAALIYSNLGLIQLRKNEPAEAKTYFNRALKVYKKYNEPKNIASALHHLGLAEYTESNYNQTLGFYLQAVELAEKSKLKKLLSQLYRDISNVYEKLGNYQSALDYNRKYETLRNELFNLEKIKQINQLETNFEIEQRETEIELLKKQAEINDLELNWTWTIVYGLIIIFIMVIIIVVLFYARNRYKKQQELLALQSRLFRSQTSPHFIFNSLMSIQTFLMENKVTIASEYLVDFAKLIRSILQHTNKTFIPLNKEIEVLQQYVKLEKLRFSDKFDYEFNIRVNEFEDIMIPPMLTQPFIENAILHGLVPAQKKGFLKIELFEDDNVLTFIIEDNGIGRKASLKQQKREDHESLATEITNKRLQLLLKRYNRKISMRIEDLYTNQNQPAGTRVSFSITIG